jgi:hypothetical protein
MPRLAPLALAFLFLAPLARAQEAITWDTLKQVKYEQKGMRYVVDFAAPLERLDGRTVTLKGFMLPLSEGATGKQAHFLLSAYPLADCFFCFPGGPEALVEVKATTPVAFAYEPVVLEGTLALLKDDPQGMFYRITDARAQ